MIDWNHPDFKCGEDQFFHEYSRSLADTRSKIVEQCVRCGYVIEFVVGKDGRIDNHRYVNAHALDFLQQDDPLYVRYYKKHARPYMSPLAKASIGDKAEYFAKELSQGMKELRRTAHY